MFFVMTSVAVAASVGGAFIGIHRCVLLLPSSVYLCVELILTRTRWQTGEDTQGGALCGAAQTAGETQVGDPVPARAALRRVVVGIAARAAPERRPGAR